MASRSVRIRQVGFTFLSALLLALCIRASNGGDYLIVNTPRRSHTLYVEDVKLSYYTTTQTADGSWGWRADQAGPRSVPGHHGTFLGFRFHRNSTDILISVPLVCCF